jgi:hypothetical protein
MTKNGRARTGLNHGGKFNEDHQLLLFFSDAPGTAAATTKIPI